MLTFMRPLTDVGVLPSCVGVGAHGAVANRFMSSFLHCCDCICR